MCTMHIALVAAQCGILSFDVYEGHFMIAVVNTYLKECETAPGSQCINVRIEMSEMSLLSCSYRIRTQNHLTFVHAEASEGSEQYYNATESSGHQTIAFNDMNKMSECIARKNTDRLVCLKKQYTFNT